MDVAWLSLFISILGLFIQIVTSKEKIKNAISDYRDWQNRKREEKVANKFIKNIADDGFRRVVAVWRLMLVYFTFIFIISSSLLSIVINQKPVGMEQYIFAAMIFFYASLIPNGLFLYFLKETNWFSFMFMIILSANIGFVWGWLIEWRMTRGETMFYSGVSAGLIIIAVLYLFSLFPTKNRKFK